MVEQLKRILLRQYIGAIVVAFVAAQGIGNLISLVMMPVTYHFLIAGRPTRGFFGETQAPPMFDWNQLIVAVVTICLQFAIVAGLIWWLFYRQPGAKQVEETAEA